jgi:hypothetical protein
MAGLAHVEVHPDGQVKVSTSELIPTVPPPSAGPMPRIQLWAHNHVFPELANGVDEMVPTSGDWDSTIYDYDSASATSSLKFISPGVFLVFGAIGWDSAWPTMDMQIETFGSGTFSGELWTVGTGLRTHTSVDDPSTGVYTREQYHIVVVYTATDASNYMSVWMDVRNLSGADRTSTAWLQAMRLTADTSNIIAT